MRASRFSQPRNVSREYLSQGHSQRGKNDHEFRHLNFAANGEFQIDMNDDVIGPSCVTHEGKWMNQRVAAAMGAPA